MLVERELTGFVVDSISALDVGSTLRSFSLITPAERNARYPGFTYKLDFPRLKPSPCSKSMSASSPSSPPALAVRNIVEGPGYPRPPHTNVVLPGLDVITGNDGDDGKIESPGSRQDNDGLSEFVVLDRPSETSIVLGFPVAAADQLADSHGNAGQLPSSDLLGSLQIHLDWSDSVVLSVRQRHLQPLPQQGRLTGDMQSTLVFSDLPGGRSLALTEHGIMRHYLLDPSSSPDATAGGGDLEHGAGGSHVHFGLGERAAPVDLTGRRFEMHGTDAAHYDAYTAGALYKHTPFVLSVPKPPPSSATTVNDVETAVEARRRLPYAIWHASNSRGSWDLGHTRDDPWGYFGRYEQDWGGMEQWLIVGDGVRDVVEAWSQVVGKPKLVPRDWLGYLASGMGLGESDSPPAQELLAGWPELCRKHRIPCSAIHFSSGYTTSPVDGKRYVFTMNKERYPDFKGLVGKLHQAGIKIVPNVKPYVLDTHPEFQHLLSSGALFHDPHSRQPIKSGKNAVVTRIWSAAPGTTDRGAWVDLTSRAGAAWWRKGVQGLIELGVDGIWNDNNEFYLHDDDFEIEGGRKIGSVGRMSLTEAMARESHDALVTSQPDRRPFVVTRSGNVGTFKYASSTWSGDNETCWKTLRGSQHMQLNAGMSLMQSYGSDVGGFCGPLPTPEMMVRWVQLGVTHTRFCIHSFKPNNKDPSGVAATNTPWMYPEVLPIIRDAIEWRYEHLPFFNSLQWHSHLSAEPANAWLGWGEFANDPEVYTARVMDGFNAWLGCGQLLTAPAVHEGDQRREVYLPKSSDDDRSLYFDLHKPWSRHVAGSWVTLDTPLTHGGLLAREGAVIPIGKRHHTVTQRKGPGRTTPDGVDVALDGGEGDLVSLDDWRAVKIFPGSSGSYSGSWIEDDGISTEPAITMVEMAYKASEGAIEVSARFIRRDFDCAWGRTLGVILPHGEERPLSGSGVSKDTEGRWIVTVQRNADAAKETSFTDIAWKGTW